MEDVLAEVQCDEGLARVLAVAVHAEGDGGGGAEGAAKGDDAEEDGRHDPGVALLGGPAEAHEPDDGGDGYGEGEDEAEFRLVQTAVASGHVADDDVADLAGDGGSQDAADEGGEVDQSCGEGREVVCVAAAVDNCHGLGEDDEPTYRACVDDA